MRSRTLLLALVLLTGSLALPLIAHAAIPFFGPIIPQASNQAVCPAGWGMLITVFNNIISLLLTLAIVFVAPIMIAWAGFLFVVNPVNPEGKKQAKSILIHTIVGIIIALMGYVIVDFILAVLINPRSPVGTWSEIIGSKGEPPCLDQKGATGTTQPTTPTPTVTTVPTPGTGRFTYTSQANAQISDASAPLSSLISCMATKLKANATITSISDSKITSGQQTFSSCRTLGSPTCAHTVNSCHYGGSRCGDKSYAVDLVGDASDLTAAAQSCGARMLNEGNHLHASVGAANNCGCDNF